MTRQLTKSCSMMFSVWTFETGHVEEEAEEWAPPSGSLNRRNVTFHCVTQDRQNPLK